MKRSALTIVAFFAASTLLASAAHAKDKVGILGVEVIGTADVRSVADAKQLTKELRKRAQLPGGKYRYSPSAERELLEMKLVGDCTDEAPTCMSKIASDLGVQILIYGKIESKGDSYEVRVTMLNARTKRTTRSPAEQIPKAALQDPTRTPKWAKLLYARLTGETIEGTLSIKANVASATIKVNGLVKGNISGGSGKIDGLPEGDHKITIEAAGYTSVERTVVIKAGRIETIEVDLVEIGSGGGGGGGGDELSRPGGGWRIMTFVAAGGVVAGGALWYLGYQKIQDEELDGMNQCIDGDCSDGDTGKLMTFIGVPITIASVALMGFSIYKGYISPGSSSPEDDALSFSIGGKKMRVTPVATPQVVGAGLDFTF